MTTSTTIAQIREALINNNGDTVIHSETETELFCMIPEIGQPFEVHITLNEDGSIIDRADDWAETYANFAAWKAQNV